MRARSRQQNPETKPISSLMAEGSISWSNYRAGSSTGVGSVQGNKLPDVPHLNRQWINGWSKCRGFLNYHINRDRTVPLSQYNFEIDFANPLRAMMFTFCALFLLWVLSWRYRYTMNVFLFLLILIWGQSLIIYWLYHGEGCDKCKGFY